MNLSRRETMQLSASALAALSVAALKPDTAAAQNAAPQPDSLVDTPLRKIEKMAVIGAGTMGGGITMSFLSAGIPVTLLEMKQEVLIYNFNEYAKSSRRQLTY